LEQCTRLAAEHPDVPDYQGRKGRALENLGWLLLQQKDDPEAAAGMLAVGAAPLGGGPLAAVLALLAGRVRRSELLREAGERLEKGMTLTRIALKPNPNHPDILQALRDQLEYLAEVRLARGEHAEAARTAGELPTVYRTRGEDYFVAAGLAARCVELAANDLRLPEAQRRALSVRYADQAIELLHQGIARGYRDAERLGKPAFTALRQRADFQKLLAGLKGVGAPGRP
jgi:hypothetical protein